MTVADILILVLIGATSLVLLAGIVFMVIGGKNNEKYSNRLMVARVAFQALAIVLAAIFLGMHS